MSTISAPASTRTKPSPISSTRFIPVVSMIKPPSRQERPDHSCRSHRRAAPRGFRPRKPTRRQCFISSAVLRGTATRSPKQRFQLVRSGLGYTRKKSRERFLTSTGSVMTSTGVPAVLRTLPQSRSVFPEMDVIGPLLAMPSATTVWASTTPGQQIRHCFCVEQDEIPDCRPVDIRWAQGQAPVCALVVIMGRHCAKGRVQMRRPARSSASAVQRVVTAQRAKGVTHIVGSGQHPPRLPSRSSRTRVKSRRSGVGVPSVRPWR